MLQELGRFARKADARGRAGGDDVARLERQAARQLGMQPMMPAQIDPLRQRSEAEAKTAPALRAEESPALKKAAGAPGKVVALKPPKPSSATIATSAKPATSVKPTSLKIQEKPRNNKASSDQKKAH